MRTDRLDSISKLLAGRRANLSQVARRQDPNASPVAVTPAKDFLFVQSFHSGSIEANGDMYTLTVDHGPGQTLYFSDRPDRLVGIAPTAQFLDGLGFSADNPPNAALVIDAGGGESDIAVVELFNPTWDPASQRISYDMVNLGNGDDPESSGLPQVMPSLSDLAPSFGSSHLFIDDCPDASIACFGFADDTVQGIAGVGGMCWSWSSLICWWCDQGAVDHLCNTTFPACVNRCHAAPLPT